MRGLDAQAIFRRRRHQPRRPPLAKIRPGRPAPTMGPGTTAKSSKADLSTFSPPVGVKRACSVLELILSGRNLTLPSTNTNGTAPGMKLEKPFPPSVGLAPIGISIGSVHGMFEPSVSPTKSVLLVPSV